MSTARLATANSDDRDGRACETDQGSHVGNGDAKKSKDGADRIRAGLNTAIKFSDQY